MEFGPDDENTHILTSGVGDTPDKETLIYDATLKCEGDVYNDPKDEEMYQAFRQKQVWTDEEVVRFHPCVKLFDGRLDPREVVNFEES